MAKEIAKIELTPAKANTAKKVSKANSTPAKADIANTLASAESLEALNLSLDIIKEEYGDYKLTQEMRQQLAEELGESEECAKGWQNIVDILDHIDLNELAKKHPERIGKVSKTIAGIIGSFCPVVGLTAIAPDSTHAKFVSLVGALTPEHLLNAFAKSQVQRKKAKLAKKQAEALEAESAPLCIDEPQTDDTEPQADYPEPQTDSAEPQGSNVEPAAPARGDIIATIKELAELKDCGILTQEEFDAKKTELLGRL